MRLDALQSRRQDFFDLLGGGGDDVVGLAIDSGAGDAGSVDSSASPATDLSTSDYLRSGASADAVDWGSGAQDGMLDAVPVSPDSNSSSDRLRGINAAQVGGVTRQEAFTSAAGGAPADPAIRTGTLDWSEAFKAVATSVGVLGGTITAVANGYNSLAGIRTGAGGTPAVGGNPGPSFLQRLLGPRTGTGVAPPSKNSAMGQLLVVGAVVGVGYLAFVHKRR